MYVTAAHDGVNELLSALGLGYATEMGFGTSALYPDIQKA
jgi:hypothetical protein